MTDAVGHGTCSQLGVIDGARTRDLRGHIPALCQLSYDHQGVQYCHKLPVVVPIGGEASTARWGEGVASCRAVMIAPAPL